MPFMGTTSSDDWKTGSIAAACGGTTSIIDFNLQGKGEMLRDAVDRQKAKADGKTVVDYSIHPGVTDARPDVIDEVKKAIHEYGTPSFKIFLFYDFRVDDYAHDPPPGGDEDARRPGPGARGELRHDPPAERAVRRARASWARCTTQGPTAMLAEEEAVERCSQAVEFTGQPDLHRAPFLQPRPVEGQAGA